MGFDGGEAVDIRLQDGSVAETKADEKGRITRAIEIPADWAFNGPFNSVAQGKSSLRFDDTQFNVECKIYPVG